MVAFAKSKLMVWSTAVFFPPKPRLKIRLFSPAMGEAETVDIDGLSVRLASAPETSRVGCEDRWLWGTPPRFEKDCGA